jgi:hypothetical protein
MLNQQSFRVLPEHIILLQRMNMRWDDCEFGAPGVDSKRPYGNSDVVSDIAEILGVKGALDRHGYEEFSDEQEDYLCKLHRQTEVVLQIFLKTGTMLPGLYESSGQYSTLSWQRVGD